MSKRLGGITGCKDKKLFMAFKRFPRCFSHFSVLVADPKKILYYTVTNPARSLLNREKKREKEKVSQRPPTTVVIVQILLKFWYFICSVHTTTHCTSIDVFFRSI